MVTFEQKPGHLNIHYFAVPPHISGIQKWHADFDQKFPEFYSRHNIPEPKPLRNILVVPATLPKASEKMFLLAEFKKQGKIDKVMIDSGGFECMTGAVEFEYLLDRNIYLYNMFQWVGDILVGLDFPPLGTDLPDIYKEKVQKTLDGTWALYEKLNPKAQAKYAPVFHPREISDIDIFWDSYLPILEKSKFATYSAASSTRGIRSINPHINNMMEELVQRLASIGASLHCLGISSPAAVRQLGEIGVRTFDSSSHLRSGAVGSILFPNHAASICSGRKGDKSITEQELKALQRDTGHICPYCENYEDLRNSSDYRQKHNLIVTEQLSEFYYNFDKKGFKDNSRKFNKIRATKAQGLLF